MKKIPALLDLFHVSDLLTSSLAVRIEITVQQADNRIVSK